MSGELEYIDHFKDSAQAVMLRDLLRNAGFNAKIKGQDGMGGTGARLMGGFTVVVPTSEAAEVRDFLDQLAGAGEEGYDTGELDTEAAGGAQNPESPPAVCPNCGSNRFYETEVPGWVRKLVTIVFLGLPLLMGKRRSWMCDDCKCHWP